MGGPDTHVVLPAGSPAVHCPRPSPASSPRLDQQIASRRGGEVRCCISARRTAISASSSSSAAIVGRYYHHPCCYWYCCCGRIAVYDACQQRRPLSSDYIQTRREPLVIKIEQQKSCRIFVDHRGSNSNPHENALMSATRIFRYYVPYPRRGH